MNKNFLRIIGIQIILLGLVLSVFEFLIDNSELVRSKYGLTDPKASPILTTFGIGTKIFTPFALIRIDTAWDKYPSGGYSKPQYIVSFGYDW